MKLVLNLSEIEQKIIDQMSGENMEVSNLQWEVAGSAIEEVTLTMDFNVRAKASPSGVSVQSLQPVIDLLSKFTPPLQAVAPAGPIQVNVDEDTAPEDGSNILSVVKDSKRMGKSTLTHQVTARPNLKRPLAPNESYDFPE